VTRDHVIRITSGPQGEDPRCSTCRRPVNWTAFPAATGQRWYDDDRPGDVPVVAFLRHWPERKP
jgi:hypothetical protein